MHFLNWPHVSTCGSENDVLCESELFDWSHDIRAQCMQKVGNQQVSAPSTAYELFEIYSDSLLFLSNFMTFFMDRR